MPDVDQNQTQFSELTPVLESALPAPVKPAADQTVMLVPPKSKKKLVVGVIGLILIIVFIFLLILIKMSVSSRPSSTEQQPQTRQTGQGEIDPVLEEIYDLDDQLLASDPTINEIPLPPVEMNLRLDPAQNN